MAAIFFRGSQCLLVLLFPIAYDAAACMQVALGLLNGCKDCFDALAAAPESSSAWWGFWHENKHAQAEKPPLSLTVLQAQQKVRCTRLLFWDLRAASV
jgi:hypothetical protein